MVKRDLTRVICRDQRLGDIVREVFHSCTMEDYSRIALGTITLLRRISRNMGQ